MCLVELIFAVSAGHYFSSAKHHTRGAAVTRFGVVERNTEYIVSNAALGCPGHGQASPRLCRTLEFSVNRCSLKDTDCSHISA